MSEVKTTILKSGPCKNNSELNHLFKMFSSDLLVEVKTSPAGF